MGGFYGSIQVRTKQREAVVEAVKALVSEDRQFLVGPQLGEWVAVYPNNSGQDTSIAAELAALISLPLIQLLVHDDDIFAYDAYARGLRLDVYDSRPDYFVRVDDAERERVRGRPERLAPLAPAAAPHAIDEVLKAGRLAQGPAYLLLERFAELLGIRNAVSSFEYLERGETETVVGWRKFTRVPDNRAAARAAAKAGVIILRDEQLPLKALFATSHGKLLTLRAGVPYLKDKAPGRVEQWSAPWNGPEPLLDSRLDMARQLSADSSGHWLATGHAFGEWLARVWGRNSGALAVEILHTQAVNWTGFTADGRHVVTLGPELIVTAMANGARVGESSRHVHGLTAVIDDARGLVAVAMVTVQRVAVFRLPQLTPIWDADTTPEWQPEEFAFAMCLDAAGDQLVMATNQGLSVYSWPAIIADGPTALKPVHAFSMPFVYAAALDTARNRVLFGGLNGTLAALDLATVVVHTLLTLPEKTTIYQLACSPSSNTLAMRVGNHPNDNRKDWSGLLVVDLEKLK